MIHDNHKAIIKLTILFSEEEEKELLADLFKNMLKNRENSVLVKGEKTNYLLEFEDERFREVVKELDEMDEEFQPIHSPVYVFLDNGEIAIE